ncbi:hypothetical protein ACJIZ3_005171 [Penstemon smallii]|uniref:Uncharacterized protein n=1 Tax=Penstemon smallii TaxID=265156 RepID=A0ABD3S4A1_9LAMI
MGSTGFLAPILIALLVLDFSLVNSASAAPLGQERISSSSWFYGGKSRKLINNRWRHLTFTKSSTAIVVSRRGVVEPPPSPRYSQAPPH